MPVNPYQQYQRQSVMTMTQGEMLTKLYDEVIKQMSGAKICLTEKDLSGVNNALQKAQRILFYLKSTLDFKYEISRAESKDNSDFGIYGTAIFFQLYLKMRAIVSTSVIRFGCLVSITGVRSSLCRPLSF